MGYSWDKPTFPLATPDILTNNITTHFRKKKAVYDIEPYDEIFRDTQEGK